MKDLKDNEERFFSEVKDKKKRGNSCKLQQGKFFQEEILYGKSPDYTDTQRNTGVLRIQGVQNLTVQDSELLKSRSETR